VAALALASSIGQIATAIPMVIATRRLRGPAALAGFGHATVAGIAAGAAGGAVGLAVTLLMPDGGALSEAGAGLIATLLAILVFGVIAYVLDREDLQTVVARFQGFTRNRT
jgi:putative peptidoglycan lipid II flippase